MLAGLTACCHNLLGGLVVDLSRLPSIPFRWIPGSSAIGKTRTASASAWGTARRVSESWGLPSEPETVEPEVLAGTCRSGPPQSRDVVGVIPSVLDEVPHVARSVAVSRRICQVNQGLSKKSPTRPTSFTDPEKKNKISNSSSSQLRGRGPLGFGPIQFLMEFRQAPTSIQGNPSCPPQSYPPKK